MGLVHKLLKRRSLEREKLAMEFTKPKDSCKSETEHMSDVDVDLVPKLATEDNQFTAEEIVQLCRFLAEKSKRNKSTAMRLASSPEQCKQHNKSQRESFSPQNYQHQHIKTAAFQAPDHRAHVLTSKVSAKANCLENPRSSNAANRNKLHNSQGKRDVLLKIRHQIFERKRRREIEEQQLDVWRPW